MAVIPLTIAVPRRVEVRQAVDSKTLTVFQTELDRGDKRTHVELTLICVIRVIVGKYTHLN